MNCFYWKLEGRTWSFYKRTLTSPLSLSPHWMDGQVQLQLLKPMQGPLFLTSRDCHQPPPASLQQSCNWPSCLPYTILWSDPHLIFQKCELNHVTIFSDEFQAPFLQKSPYDPTSYLSSCLPSNYRAPWPLHICSSASLLGWFFCSSACNHLIGF